MKTRASENVMISTMLQSRKRLEQEWSRMAENRRLYANDWSMTGAAMFCSSRLHVREYASERIPTGATGAIGIFEPR